MVCNYLVYPGGTIQSITLIPSSPTASDTLRFYVSCTLPSSGCPHDVIYSGIISDSTISASTIHCMGMLAVLCNAVDTVIVTPKPAGNYHFVFTLNSGYGTPSCTPGIVSDDTDTLDFTVTPSTGVQENKPGMIHVFPNPANDQLYVKLPVEAPKGFYIVTILDALGRNVFTQEIEKNTNSIEFDLPNGAYFIEVRERTGDNKYISHVIVNRL